MKYRKLTSSLALLVSLLPLTACALSGKAIDGKVLEEGTQQPIPSAIVVARWQGHLASWGHGKTVCYHVLTTTSDERGHFHFPAWKKDITEDWQKNIRPEDVLIDAYKPGYGLPTAPSQKREIVLLKPFTGTRGQRFQSLWRNFRATGCHAAGRSARNLYPLYKATYEESKPLAATDEEKRLLQIMRELTASAWIAEDDSRSTGEEQKLIKEFLRDHLP
ncbi:MAG: hypothetical protein WD823_08780 [Sulfuricaulis sp.]|uniref:hypothetical protein n=1 Tax=Sulfuricaulis sp. TaxID=2003553 RepID=UPI0034A38489